MLTIIMFFRFLLCAFLAVQIVQGKTEEEVRAWFLRQGIECNKEHSVTPEEMQMIHKSKLPDTPNAKCLVACVFKKANYINAKGMVDLEAAIAEGPKMYEDNTEKIENFKKLMTNCEKVNSEAVGDGEAGCDRAALLLKCFSEQAPQLGFKMHV